MATRSKYNVDKKTYDRTLDGIIFDSVVEMKYYRDVILPGLKSGEIVAYERQKRYILQKAFLYQGKKVKAIEYKADFYVVDKTGKETVIDIKGCPDAVAKLKRKMFWCVYPEIDYKWISYVKKYGGWIEFDECKRLRKASKRDSLQGDKSNK